MFKAGSDTSVSLSVWRLSFRSVTWMREAVAAALALLTDEYNWVGTTEVDAETAADFGIETTLSFLPASNIIGTIQAFAGELSNAPLGTLPCDGSSYLRADYPDLFNAIGTTWGTADGTHFNVPDLRSVVLIGAGQQSPFSDRTLAATIGEEDHTLTSGEMPAHTHTEISAITSVGVVGEIPAPVTIPSVAVTGSAGGSGAHNNMQPSTGVTFIIVASAP